MIKLLAWVFPMLLLPVARKLGSVSFTEVAGVGWQCSIRPDHSGQSWSRRGLNSWSGTGKTLGLSLKAAIQHANAVGRMTRDGDLYAPKLGGPEFDE